MKGKGPILDDLNERAREVFRRVVEGYLESGAPVGSRSLTRSMSEKVSAATIRNVMQDLEFLGLLGSPHVSAGRVPTHLGLRMFVDGFLEVSDIPQDQKQVFENSLSADGSDVPTLLDRVGAVLSKATQGASLVLAPKHGAPIQHIDFVSLSNDQALVVLVFTDGHVENRVFTPPPGTTPSAMREAANFLNNRIEGHTVDTIQAELQTAIDVQRREIDEIASRLISSGLALWSADDDQTARLIVRGRANLLDEAQASDDLEKVRQLMEDLERKRDIAEFLELTEGGEGVRIFIGSENKLFSLSGSSLVVSPYMNAERKIIGAVGVIGPTRLNYGKIVPIVDYTAQMVSRLISDRG